MEEVPVVIKPRKKRLHGVMYNETVGTIVEQQTTRPTLQPFDEIKSSSFRNRYQSMNGEIIDNVNISGKEIDLLNISRKSSIMSLEYQSMREDIAASVSFKDDHFSFVHLFRSLSAILFVTLDVDQSSLVARYLGVLTNAVIVVAVLNYIGKYSNKTIVIYRLIIDSTTTSTH